MTALPCAVSSVCERCRAAAARHERDNLALLCAAAVRHRVGLLRGGDAGRAQAEEARAAALALGVRSPERWFRSLLPGFPD